MDHGFDDIFTIIGNGPSLQPLDDFSDVFKQISEHSSSYAKPFECLGTLETEEYSGDAVADCLSIEADESDEGSSDSDTDEVIDKLDDDSSDILEGITIFYSYEKQF